MQQITLSDHTGTQLQQARQARMAQADGKLAAWRQRQASRREALAQARASMRQAWWQRKLFAVIGHGLRAAWMRCMLWRKAPAVAAGAPGQQEAIWAAGREGEANVAAFLGQRLGAEWTLLAGYHNPRGEIDQVLVGPTGVFAIEVKHVAGDIHVRGDAWTRDKHDRYGNLVKVGEVLADKGGRSPGRQVGETTAQMLAWLRKSMPALACRPVVVLSHPRARIATRDQASVIVVELTRWKLENTVLALPVTLSPSQCAQAVELLRRDHAHHRTRRQSPQNKQHERRVMRA